VGSECDAERYSADYGNLFLEVSLRVAEQEYAFVVTDQADGLICWRGSASDLANAQSSAILEAQLFLDPYIASPPAPQWRHNAEPAAHI
jgi:hypothetical protein